MSKVQTRLLIVPQVLPPRGVVVATGEEVAVGAPPAHVPGVGLGPRFDEVQRLDAGVGRPESQILVAPVRKLNLSSSTMARTTGCFPHSIARAEDGRALLLGGERSVQNFLVGGPVGARARALLEFEPRLPSNPRVAEERVRAPRTPRYVVIRGRLEPVELFGHAQGQDDPYRAAVLQQVRRAEVAGVQYDVRVDLCGNQPVS